LLTKEKDDYDSPWKDIIDLCFPQFMAFFFPEAAEEIDWERGYILLDKEFQKIVKEAELGRTYADKLIQVCKKNGDDAWVLIHIEVQGQDNPGFAERMFVYNYRIFDKYKRSVASFAILSDENPNWCPKDFGYKLLGCKVQFEFSVAKILEYRSRWGNLEKDSNPFAVVVMAHLKTQETRSDMEERKRWKFNITKSLYGRGYSRDDILNLYRFIDWIMKLPEEAEALFQQDMEKFEEEKKMQYVTNAERIGIKKGIPLGMIKDAQEMVIEALEVRFGIATDNTIAQVRSINQRERLKSLHRQAILCETMDAFQEMLAKALN
jgi:hypothetical protein